MSGIVWLSLINMDIIYTKPLTKNSYNILRAAGYVPVRDRKTGKESYVFKFRGDRYPRFHLYVEEEAVDQIKWHLHLDHKEHGWGERRHDTEYEGEEVEAEGARLQRWLVHFTQSDSSKKEEKKENEGIGGIIAKIFG